MSRPLTRITTAGCLPLSSPDRRPCPRPELGRRRASPARRGCRQQVDMRSCGSSARWCPSGTQSGSSRPSPAPDVPQAVEGRHGTGTRTQNGGETAAREPGSGARGREPAMSGGEERRRGAAARSGGEERRGKPPAAGGLLRRRWAGRRVRHPLRRTPCLFGPGCLGACARWPWPLSVDRTGFPRSEPDLRPAWPGRGRGRPRSGCTIRPHDPAPRPGPTTGQAVGRGPVGGNGLVAGG
jgi:hypothetical protein